MEMKWILVVCGMFVSSSALAVGGACGDRDYFLDSLEEKYEEVVRYRAITGSGALVEFTVAPDGGWSMLVTFPNGTTCMTAEGTDWQDMSRTKGTRA